MALGALTALASAGGSASGGASSSDQLTTNTGPVSSGAGGFSFNVGAAKSWTPSFISNLPDWSKLILFLSGLLIAGALLLRAVKG